MIHSAAGLRLPSGGLVQAPPFRAPHHTASVVSMVGGGTAAMRPGEVSCAHGGVLFLDELAEFATSVLDGLREPLEEGVVRVTRARATVEFPARFLLVAAMNPCPCGGGAKPGGCTCGSGRARYLRRVSGPLLDRFDLRLEVKRPAVDELLGGAAGETTAVAVERVRAARARGRVPRRRPQRRHPVPSPRRAGAAHRRRGGASAARARAAAASPGVACTASVASPERSRIWKTPAMSSTRESSRWP